MSEQYIPLYRKYRPKTLQEIVGQEHIKKSLANAISLNKISHAYLFTGPRGTGKTSIARILAKSLNCQEGPTLTPCNKCPSCLDIMNSVPIDVIEIDAASNRSVEDAQNIIEKIQYVPVNGKFKIYIIDEVHMLTNHAFNALLKTLEEPPENVIFILATTEPQKVLETITSRCQRFDFRRITTEDIISHLKYVAKEEKINIEDDALFTIAKNAAGGMRDSLALLDQVSVLDSSKTITTEDINSLLGRLSFDLLYNLAEKIIESKPQDAIEDLEKIYNSGNEPTQILVNLLGYFKNLLIVKNCKDAKLVMDLTQLNESQLNALKIQSENIDTHQVVFLIERISYYIKELKTTNNQHLWLEISMIDLANLAQNTSLLDLQSRISKLESGAPVQSAPQPYITQPAPIPKAPIAKVEENLDAKVQVSKEAEIVETGNKKPEAELLHGKENSDGAIQIVEKKVEPENFSPMPKSQSKENSEDEIYEIRQQWAEFLAIMNKKSPSTCAMLSQHSKLVEISAKKVVIACEKEFSVKSLNTENKKKFIIEVAEELLNTKGVNVTVRLSTPTDKIIKDSPVEKKNLIVNKKSISASQKDEDEDSEEIIEEITAITSSKIPQSAPPMHSDQVTMVMKLLDGKYID